MTLLYFDRVFLEHNTGGHPENAGRLRAVLERMKETGFDESCKRVEWQPATDDQLQQVHSARAIASIQQFINQGGGRIEQDTVVSDESLRAARIASGAVCDAVGRVVKGEDKTAFCMVRPPGHHALEGGPMGFCLLNHVAIGARFAIKQLSLQKVLIVDWDVHHGNGTQDTFWEDPQVGFLSMHRFPFYPGSGAKDEIGGGEGLGWTVNVPIRFGTSRQDQLAHFRKALEAFADRLKPELVLVSAGFDSHVRDPIGSLQLESEDFIQLTQIVQDVAEAHAGGRIVSLLEGGYHPQALAESVECHLKTLQQ